jgi:hypothetical protein
MTRAPRILGACFPIQEAIDRHKQFISQRPTSIKTRTGSRTARSVPAGTGRRPGTRAFILIMAQPARDATDAGRGMESIDHNPVAPHDASLLTTGGASAGGADRVGDEGESWRTPARHLHLSSAPEGLRSVARVTREQHQGHVPMTQHGFLAPDPGRHHSRPAGSAGVLGVSSRRHAPRPPRPAGHAFWQAAGGWWGRVSTITKPADQHSRRVPRPERGSRRGRCGSVCRRRRCGDGRHRRRGRQLALRLTLRRRSLLSPAPAASRAETDPALSLSSTVSLHLRHLALSPTLRHRPLLSLHLRHLALRTTLRRRPLL